MIIKNRCYDLSRYYIACRTQHLVKLYITIVNYIFGTPKLKQLYLTTFFWLVNSGTTIGTKGNELTNN